MNVGISLVLFFELGDGYYKWLLELLFCGGKAKIRIKVLNQDGAHKDL